MSSILDYLRWRGDLPLASIPLGEVDGLILSQLSMLFWEEGLGAGGSETLKSLGGILQGKPFSVGYTAENDVKLLEAVAGSERFGGIVLSDYEHAFDDEAGIQFAAVTLRLPDNSVFVSFRGTDNTLVGWKEDFAMTYSRSVPAQEAAAMYLRRIAGRYPGRLYAGGHSKGGNLAMYAAAHLEEGQRARIAQVYNNDGPGFNDSAFARDIYGKIQGQLLSFVPQSSVIGMLLNHPEDYEIVASDSIGIWQHDPYSWQVEGPRFVRRPALAGDSVYVQNVVRRWLSEVEEEERCLFIETLFQVLKSTDARSFGKDFWLGLFTHPGAVLASIKDIDPESRRRINRVWAELAKAAVRREGKEEKPLSA